MKPKILLSLALVLSGRFFCQFAAAQIPGNTAPPAAKDAYVAAQLAKLFVGARVRVALGHAFNNWLLVDVSAVDAKAGLTNRPVTKFSVSLFGFDNEAAARDNIRDELVSFKQPVTVTKAGYDEFYSGEGGRLIGRHGAVVVVVYSSPPKGSDAVFAAIAKNLSANPTLLPDLIHYAYTMHFGDAAPLRVVLSKLNEKFPELSEASFDTNSPFYAENGIVADYTVSGDNKMTIVAKAYDSAAAAKTGQAHDQGLIQAGGWNKKRIIHGVQVYENTDYGTMYFQTGHYTFKLMVTRYSHEEVPPLLLKVSSALITTFAPPIGKQ